MLRRSVENCGGVHERVTADAGYFSAQNVRVAESYGAEPFIAPGGLRHDGRPAEESHLPNWTDAKRAMRRTLETPRGRAAYARRKATVEPVFGQIRTRGYQHVSFRGLIKNRLEWLFVCATHNVLKLWRAVGEAKLQLAA